MDSCRPVCQLQTVNREDGTGISERAGTGKHYPEKLFGQTFGTGNTMPKLLEKYRTDNEKLQKDIPIFKEVVESTWRKESELKALKDDLIKLDREIQLSLKPIEESEGQAENIPENGKSQGKTEAVGIQNSSMPYPKEEIKGTLEDRFAMASASSPPKVERKEASKGFKL